MVFDEVLLQWSFHNKFLQRSCKSILVTDLHFIFSSSINLRISYWAIDVELNTVIENNTHWFACFSLKQHSIFLYFLVRAFLTDSLWRFHELKFSPIPSTESWHASMSEFQKILPLNSWLLFIPEYTCLKGFANQSLLQIPAQPSKPTSDLDCNYVEKILVAKRAINLVWSIFVTRLVHAKCVLCHLLFQIFRPHNTTSKTLSMTFIYIGKVK